MMTVTISIELTALINDFLMRRASPGSGSTILARIADADGVGPTPPESAAVLFFARTADAGQASYRGMIDALTKGRDAFRRRAWADAFTALSMADETGVVGIEDLEILAESAYLAGRELDFQRVSERAHRAYVAAREPVRASRIAFWLGLTSLFRGESGPASGWLGRAERLLESRDCVERGYLLLPEAEQCLGAGNGDAAYDVASRAAAIGRRFLDADLVACARHLEGRALLQRGRIEAGLVLLDEAMLDVVAAALSPIMTGLIYCSVIEACQQVYALSRAREWTHALSRWCEQQPQMVAFTGTCLVHRAEVLQFGGAWPNAMLEARRACERSREADRNPPGSAFYQQAEIHRFRGDFAAAEEAYRGASRLGCDPQPGLSLLRLAQGRTDVAAASIRRALNVSTDRLQRARLLPACIEILLATGALEEACNASRELEQIAEHITTDALRAMAKHGRGAVEHASGNARAAVVTLRRAFDAWQRIEAPYAEARVRVLIGLACRDLHDEESAALEFQAARFAFERLGAAPDLGRLEALENAVERADTANARPSLTGRELQVLRLIATGRTNKAIATELSVSERTIDRHVSNILTKLDVPSRAAATAYACTRQLF
jgi:ATP/maltotriose-dependent transcriptional regulator MalT